MLPRPVETSIQFDRLRRLEGSGPHLSPLHGEIDAAEDFSSGKQDVDLFLLNRQKVWVRDPSVPLVPSFLVKEDLLFRWTESGVVTCLDEATGQVHWRERVDGDFYNSPLWIEGRLYGISKRGEVVVLAASRKFEELGRVDLGEKSFATPAVVGGVMYLRTQTRLLALPGGE